MARCQTRFLAWAVSIGLTGFAAAGATAEELECFDAPEGRLCKVKQPLTNGDLVSNDLQRSLGLVTVNGGCSGTMLNEFWVLTADHCVTSNGQMGGPTQPLANLPITAAWSAQTLFPTRLVRYFNSNNLDVALVYLGSTTFGEGSVRLIYHNEVDDSMTLTKYGRGIFAFATGSGPTATQSQQDGQYRSARFTPSAASATMITLPMNAANQVGNGGDSGGPDFVTGEGGSVLGIASVQSTCVASGYVPGMPQNWNWATGITSCNSAALYTLRDDILRVIKEKPRPYVEKIPGGAEYMAKEDPGYVAKPKGDIISDQVAADPGYVAKPKVEVNPNAVADPGYVAKPRGADLGNYAAAGVAGAGFDGRWSTRFGDLALSQSGANVAGEYGDGGRIVGTVAGQVFTGKWSEPPTRAEPDDAGDVTFTLNGPNSFTGCWRYGSTAAMQCDWSGTRK